ncbi:DUF2798 domain-containing protein [Undibacterium sp. CY18W]|uniref:DUF2798 domain-containing protein n=1 Tax=Undibacterium hunanense TaxID=2762292 RepID=A0ABR6ZY91_9BURK|nr:DUF2798 domain-containing protein [Undibacterium hunanense]MBC3920802.1 DUF2798 domain-containing protein [Undibacterium hunanense]
MQHSSAFPGMSVAAVQPAIVRQPRAVAGSKSLASMLPTILTTGVVTLVASAAMRLLWIGYGNDFFAAWMEAWLTIWPIAFPVAYLSKPLVNQLARSLSKPLPTADMSQAGLNVNAVMQASDRATAQSGLKRKPVLLPVHR